MDLHADQIQGFFDIPVDNIYSLPILLDDIWKQNYETRWWFRPTSAAWCAPARWPSASNAIWRSSTSAVPKANVSEVMNIIGEVEGRTCIIMDDMVDTAGTLCKAATALKKDRRQQGHRLLYAPGAVRPARRAGQRAPISTNWSSPTPFRCATTPPPRRASASLSVAELMAETIRRISNDDSVSSLFID